MHRHGVHSRMSCKRCCLPVKVTEIMDPEAGHVHRDGVVLACEVLECCPWFEFADLDVYGNTTEEEADDISTDPDELLELGIIGILWFVMEGSILVLMVPYEMAKFTSSCCTCHGWYQGTMPAHGIKYCSCSGAVWQGAYDCELEPAELLVCFMR